MSEIPNRSELIAAPYQNKRFGMLAVPCLIQKCELNFSSESGSAILRLCLRKIEKHPIQKGITKEIDRVYICIFFTNRIPLICFYTSRKGQGRRGQCNRQVKNIFEI